MANLNLGNLIPTKALGEKDLTPPRLKFLMVIVDRNMAPVYSSMLEDYEVNVSLSLYARGSLIGKIPQGLALATPKSVIVATVREDRVDELLSYLEDKFSTLKGGKGIAFTVPVSSLIGVSSYQFLSNQKGEA